MLGNESSPPGRAVALPPPAFANRMLFPDIKLLRARRQTVIRVRGRQNLQPGEILEAVTEGWQLKCPVALSPVAKLEVVSVRQEPLRVLLDDPEYAERELSLEAVASGISPRVYVDITRIEFRYV